MYPLPLSACPAAPLSLHLHRWQELLSVDSIILTLSKYILGLIMFIHTAGCLVALQAFLQRNNPNSYFNRTDFTSPPGDPPSLMPRGPFVQVRVCIAGSHSASTYHIMLEGICDLVYVHF